MGANRYYFPDDLHEEKTISLEGDEFHHLARVMRAREGETVEIINGKNSLAKAKVLSLSKTKASLSLLEVINIPPTLPQIILIQALLKPAALEWVIEKGTELGVTAFYLFPAHGSEKKELSPNQMKRLDQMRIGGIKQCGRLDLPTIEFAASLDKLSLPEGHAFFGDLRISAPLLIEMKSKSPYTLFIGPEKGFTENEIEIMEKKYGAQGVRLHPYTLRAETAAITALSLAASLCWQSC